MGETELSDNTIAPDPRNEPGTNCTFRFFFCHLLLFIVISAGGLYLDLATKRIAFEQLGMPREYLHEENPELFSVYWVWKDLFGFQTSLNEGALFGMGQGQSQLFALLSLVAFVGIVGWVIHSAWRSRFLTITLALIIAGILGNLYDRLGLHGLRWNDPDTFHAIGEPVYAVRDWILVMIGTYHWPNFNIADSMLVCGAILLVFHSFFMQESEINPTNTQ